MDSGTLRLLAAAGHRMTVPSGAVLLAAGDRCSGYLIVLQGAVRLQKTSEGGREIVLYRLGPGESCPLNISALLTGEPYPVDAVTETAVTAIILSEAAFNRLIAGSDVFRRSVFSIYSSRMVDLLQLIDKIAFGRIDVRLAGWLVEHAANRPVKATQQELAAELGTAREVVARQLKKFEMQGWLTRRSRTIEVLNPVALRRLVTNPG